MQISAVYFDGRTSRRHVVTLEVKEDVARISGDTIDNHERLCPLSQLRVSERLRHAARKVTYPDGAYLEIEDNAAFSEILKRTHHQDSLVVRMQQNWRATLTSLAGLIALLVISYLYLLPVLANVIARTLPVGIEQRIGTGALTFLDQHILAPSKLTAAEREAITRRFHALAAVMEDLPPYEIVFRKSRIGPNALALPSGQIVLTDEIVDLLREKNATDLSNRRGDDAVMGVLAHELGHLQQRHMMRRLIQSSAVGAAMTVLFGDVSAVVANVPTLLLDMKYSRDAEREADDYAIALFKANGMDRQQLAYVFEKLGELENGKDSAKDSNNATAQKKEKSSLMPYLSTHPASDERVERILQAH